MRIVVLGTGPFAVPSLRKLHASKHDVVLAITRPPKGRRKELLSPVHEAAAQLGIEVWMPETVNSPEVCTRLAEMNLDLLVVCDYGEILKPPVLVVSRLGGINLHGSLLPKYRGAAPVQWAVLNGDQETGNTVIQMTPGLDAGPCLGVQRVAIGPDETAGELESRLAGLGANLVQQVVDQFEAGTTTPTTQEQSRVTKAPRLSKSDGQIDWAQPAKRIKNQVRALQPWPRAFTSWQRAGGEPVRLIVHRVSLSTTVSSSESAEPGTVALADSTILVTTGDGLLRLEEIQPAGKRAMTAEQFLRGYPLQVGDRFA